MQFVFRAVDEVGATLNAALVVIGDKLGLYRALAGTGRSLVHGTGRAHRHGGALRPRMVDTQAAGGYVEYDPESGRYALPPEQTVALTDPDSPAYLPGFFQIAVGSVLDSPKILEAARSGEGLGWHEHVHDVHDGCERSPSGIQRAPDRRVAARARRGRRQAGARCTRRGRGLWPRLVDDPDGRGVPELDVRRF